MNAMVNIAIPQPVVNNVAANTKSPVQNTSSGDTPSKNFSDVFKEATTEPEITEDSVTENIESEIPIISSTNNVIVLVNVSAIPVLQIEAEPAMPVINANVVNGNSDIMVSIPDPKSTAAQIGFTELLQNAKNPATLLQPSSSENNQVVDQPAQNTAAPKPVIPAAEVLLNLLNGKNPQSLQNAALLTDAIKQPQSNLQVNNQSQSLQMNQTSETSVANVATATTMAPVVAVANRPTVEMPLRPVNKQVENKLDMTSSTTQTVPLTIEENVESQIVPRTESTIRVKPIVPEATPVSLTPDKSMAGLKGAEIENSNKPLEPINQQFGQFVTNAMNTRVEGSALAQPTSGHMPEAFAKYDIHGQIIEQARLIKSNEDTQMVIKLRPEHLGELTLKVSVEHGVVSATFHSDNAQVRTMLETSLIQLKQELASQGIKVDNVGVYAGLGQFLSDGQGQSGREQQSTRFKNRKINLADFEEETTKLNGLSGVNTATEDGVDYRI